MDSTLAQKALFSSEGKGQDHDDDDIGAKQKIVHGRGPSNINLGIFVCSFDVCRAS